MKPEMEEIDIQPNKACWILVDGRVADVSEEGWNDEGTAFSHGIFVKQWVKFRTHNFCPEKSEREMASGIQRRAQQIFAEKPEILVETVMKTSLQAISAMCRPPKSRVGFA
jgi:hypothetical protein